MVINRKGKKLVRKMESCNKKYGPDERGLIKFIEPPDVRGIMYLTWSYEDVNRDDDMWTFLPAESLVRRISGGGKKCSFIRSDCANEDIEKKEVDDDEHKLLRSEKFSGVNCYVVERINKKAEKHKLLKAGSMGEEGYMAPDEGGILQQKGQTF